MSITARLATACPLDCPDTCSLEVTVEDGRLVAIDAGPANPLTQGFICAKVKHHARRVYAPERSSRLWCGSARRGRVTFGLRRGTKRSTWSRRGSRPRSRRRSVVGRPLPVQLVCRVARRRGSHLAGCSTSSARPGCCTRSARRPPARLGSRRSGRCSRPIRWTSCTASSWWCGAPTPPISNTHFPPLVQQARAQGARLVVVDPRRTAMARRADRHLALSPAPTSRCARHGASLDRSELIDRSFVDAHARGRGVPRGSAEWTLSRTAE